MRFFNPNRRIVISFIRYRWDSSVNFETLIDIWVERTLDPSNLKSHDNYSHVNQLELTLTNLQRAIELDPKNRKLAKTDPDFDHIRNDARFQALIQK
jgi:hypothetical protein